MNSKWVIMDIGYHMKILSLICNYVEECSWGWDSQNIPKLTIVEALKDVEPDFVISQVFDFYFHPATVDLGAQEEHLKHEENPLMNYVADQNSISGQLQPHLFIFALKAIYLAVPYLFKNSLFVDVP